MARVSEDRWWIGFFVLASILLTAYVIFAQTAITKITDVQPASGKVNDTITVTGENLGKPTVSGVFLSDDKNDYKATIVEQAAGKIVAKVPELKPGDYNISVQTGNQIIIEPVKFKVEQ